MRKPHIIVATVDGSQRKIECYRAVIAYLERKKDEDCGLIFAILRQAIVDIATAEFSADVRSALEFLDSRECRMICEASGLDYGAAVEMIYKHMPNDIEDAKVIISPPPTPQELLVKPAVAYAELRFEQLSFDGF